MSAPGSSTADETKLARKAEMRSAAVAARDALPVEERLRAAQTVAAIPLPFSVNPGAVVSGYMPIRSEINPVPLLKRFPLLGATLALPAIAGRGKPLTMRAWRPGERMVRGQWGIREPAPEVPQVSPDVLIVPLAAFDRRGFRIGYGAGYYDMTLAALRAQKPVLAVGLAFAVQEVPHVPDFPYDQRLDFVLTEREAIDCRPA